MSIYKITSIKKVAPPEGVTNKRWYQYVIKNHINTITSLRAGTEKEVRKVAADAVKRLNEIYLTRYNSNHYYRPVNENILSAYS